MPLRYSFPHRYSSSVSDVGLILPPIHKMCSPQKSTALVSTLRLGTVTFPCRKLQNHSSAKPVSGSSKQPPGTLWTDMTVWGARVRLRAALNARCDKHRKAVWVWDQLVTWWDFFVTMGIIPISSRGSESIQVKVTLHWMVCGIRTKVNTNREKKWAADSLSGFDTPSQLLPTITAVVNIHNYYNKEFSSICKIKLISMYFATGPP